MSYFNFRRFGALTYFCLVSSLIFLNVQRIYADDFFGDELSEREKFSQQASISELTSSIENIESITLLLTYSAFKEGRCEEYFEIEAAAKNGDAKNQWILSDLYRQGLCVPQDDARALHWVQKAAEGGLTEAYYDFGLFLLQGVGTDKNPRAAVEWLEKATNYRTEVYYHLALIYLNGEGAPQNFNKAFQYAHLGATYGDPPAQVITSILCSMEGFGFSNSVDAYKWAIVAKSNGRKEIAGALSETLETLDNSMTTAQIADAQDAALNWTPLELQPAKSHDPTEVDLPEIDFDSVAKLTANQAATRLEELGMEKDRFLFFKAIEEDNVGITALYIRAGASVEVFSPVLFHTPVTYAAVFGSVQVVKYLLAAGANIDRSLNSANDSAVLYAFSKGHRNVAELLIEHGAKLNHPGIMYNAVEFNDPALLAELKSKGVPVDEEYVSTPLANAVSAVDDNGDRHCLAASAEFLLNSGARTNVLNSNGDSLVQSAMGTTNPYPCVKLLLENGASPTASTGQEPLFYAVMIGNADVVELLLTHGANANLTLTLTEGQVPYVLGEKAKDVVLNGGSILQVAVEEQHASIARFLVQYGANVDTKDNKGRTPLSAARANNDALMVSILEAEN